MPVELGFTGTFATTALVALSITLNEPLDAAYTCCPSGATARSVGADPTGTVATTAGELGTGGACEAMPPHPATSKDTIRQAGTRVPNIMAPSARTRPRPAGPSPPSRRRARRRAGRRRPVD